MTDSSIIYAIDQSYPNENYSLESIESSLNNKNYYNIILNVDGVDVGYLSATIICGECELLKVVVHSNDRGKGYGNMLLIELKSYCMSNGVEKIFLEVRVDNDVAKKLYVKNGFKKCGERKGYYNGIDGEVYWCKLNGQKN